MRCLVVSLALILAHGVTAVSAQDARAPSTLNVYIDADFTIAWQSAQSIEHGISAAFASRGFQVADHELDIITLDHRANARRSIVNLREFDADPAGIAVIGGMHSPPYIRHLTEINERQIPLLLAWSANGTLTRQQSGRDNWVFRLSVDDQRVGPFLAGEMVDGGCSRIGLVVLDNGWGLYNLTSISSALEDMEEAPVYTATLATDIGSARARHVAAELSAADVDCLALVGNAGNSAALSLAMSEQGLNLRVFSHWGVLAGGFVDMVSHDARAAMQLTVVQSCGLHPQHRNGDALGTALAHAAVLGWSYEELSDVPAPAGFVHGYDLGLILLDAIEQAAQSPDWHDGPEARRSLLREALENLDNPVTGILRTYEMPFSPVSNANADGHEALSEADLCLAQFDERGRLVAWSPSSPIEEALLAP